MCCLIRCDTKVTNKVDVRSIISEVADEKLEEKIEEIKKVEENPDNIPEDAVAANESAECR